MSIGIVESAFAQGFEPEPDLTVSEWADTHRILSQKASSEPGQWRTSRTPYLREIMDCLSPNNPIQRVVVQAGAQVGKTECGNNWIGYMIHRAPASMLMVQPTVEMAKRVSKQRIAPMIEATPAIRERVKEARSRDSGNTIFVKECDGGILMMTGANSSAGLRSMPIARLFCDEIDAYPGDVDGQGDPVALAEKRTITFPRKKILLTSSPTIKGVSRIEAEYKASDQRHFFVPCPHCGNMDWIRWENIRWEPEHPSSAYLQCTKCEKPIGEHYKTAMLLRGEWRASATSRTAGFHLSGLYSPLGWKSWAECVEEFISAKDDPFKLKTWVNTVLGETWEERGDVVDARGVLARLESYPAEVPAGVGVLVAAVDVQGDRLEAQIKGYGAGEESWLIAFSQFHGDPGQPEVWFELDRFLLQSFKHESGQELRVHCCCVDSGGHHTEEVYKFCKVRTHRRVFAVRGGTMTGKEIVGRPSTKNRYRVALFTLCTDTAKDVIYSRLRINGRGPGFMHLPEWVDAEYAEQLTAEKSIRKWVKGKGAVREWKKMRERNEALDLEVYSLAALYILGQPFIRSLPQRAAKLNRPPDGPPAPEPPPTSGTLAKPPKQMLRRPRGWVNKWRGE